MERAVGVEPITSSLGSSRSANWATPAFDWFCLYPILCRFCKDIFFLLPVFGEISRRFFLRGRILGVCLYPALPFKLLINAESIVWRCAFLIRAASVWRWRSLTGADIDWKGRVWLPKMVEIRPRFSERKDCGLSRKARWASGYVAVFPLKI